MTGEMPAAHGCPTVPRFALIQLRNRVVMRAGEALQVREALAYMRKLFVWFARTEKRNERRKHRTGNGQENGARKQRKGERREQ